MSAFPSLEKKLDDIFVKQAPELPSNGKKALVKYLPWINLILGLLTLYTVYILWKWAHAANNLVDYANSLSAAYGGPQIDETRMSVGIWLGLGVLLATALLYIAAYPATRDRKQSGWDLMFYALLLNVVYGIVVLFTDYGGLGSLLGAIIGSAIGMYLLFQIRDSYRRSRPRTAGRASKKA